MAIVDKNNTELELNIKKRYIRILILVCLTFIFYKVYKPIAIISGIILIINITSKKLRIYEQGAKGEAYAQRILKRLNDSYHLFYDVTVPFDNKESQLDTIVIGDNGIFIIEVKNINGKVKGDISDRNLTIEKTGKKGTKYYKEMYNPYKQVKTHVYRLNKYLQQYNILCPIVGLVYFKCEQGIFENGNNSINISNSDNIIFDNSEKLLSRIESNCDYRVSKYKDAVVNKISLLNK